MKMNSREIRSIIEKKVAEAIDGKKGQFDLLELSDEVLAKVARAMANDSEAYAELFSNLIARDVRASVRRRSIEHVAPDEEVSDDLFPESLLDNVLMIDPSTAIRVRHATMPMFETAHERRRKNAQKQIAAVEKWDERLMRLRELGMGDDPTMTFESAMVRFRGPVPPSPSTDPSQQGLRNG